MNTKTIKSLFPFLILLAFLAYNLEAEIENSFPNGAVTIGSTQTITGAKDFTASPTVNGLTLATRQYVNEAVAAGNLNYYFSETNSDVVGYEYMFATETAAISTETTAVTSANYTLIDQWITPTGGVGLSYLEVGSIEIVRWLQKSAGANIDVISELYSYSALGVETFIATSSARTVTDTTISFGQRYFQILAQAALATTDRLVVKFYVRKSGVGANPNITLWYGNGYSSRLSAPVSGAITMLTNAQNAELPTARTNLDVYSKEEARIYTDTLATTSALNLTNHAAQNDTHGCTNIASAAALAAHNDTSTAHNSTTLASEAYVTGYSAKKAGDAAQDFSAKDLSVSGILSNVVVKSAAADRSVSIGNISGSKYFGIGWNLSGELATIDTFAYSYPMLFNNGAVTILPGNGAAGEVLIATTTDTGDYKLQVAGAGYFTGALKALSYSDNSDSPETLADAYEIIQSHETKNGRLDHSKLSSKAWGKKSVQVGVNKIMKQIGTETKEIGEPVYEERPDQAARNISMVVSAQALAISDLLKRIEALEKK